MIKTSTDTDKTHQDLQEENKLLETHLQQALLDFHNKVTISYKLISEQ